MAAYARQAKDSELIQYATEIKVRAERRCGELLRVTDKNTGVRHVGSAVERCDRRETPTLADMGLTRDESSRYQQLAAMPAEHFETAGGPGSSSAPTSRTQNAQPVAGPACTGEAPGLSHLAAVPA